MHYIRRKHWKYASTCATTYLRDAFLSLPMKKDIDATLAVATEFVAFDWHEPFAEMPTGWTNTTLKIVTKACLLYTSPSPRD